MTTEDKIRKLLDLAGSPNEHEAKLAMDRARELMAKYSIILYDEDGEKVKPTVICQVYAPPVRLNNANFKYTTSIVFTIGKHFGVYPLIHNRNQIKLYGFKTNISLACYAFDAIFNQLNAAFRLGYSKERSITFSEAFWYGAAQSIARKFELKVAVSEALVVYDPVRDVINKNARGSFETSYNPASLQGQAAGEQAGNETSIYKGVQSKTERGNLLC